jgi:uncharacterized protein (TIGR00255 family)
MMIYSMTGFGAHRQPLIISQQTVAFVYLELRSVNSRFLDLVFRTPDEARFSETSIREIITKRLSRGKLECRIHIQRDAGQESESDGINYSEISQKFHTEALNDLKLHEEYVKQYFPRASDLSVRDILNWPGVLRQEDIAADELQEAIQIALDAALNSLIQSRKTEGEALTKVILECLAKMEAIVQKIEVKLPLIIQSYQDKLKDKLLTVLNGVDQQGRNISKEEVVERIKQEVVLYGVRIDVAEEIARLKTHFQAVKAALNNGGPVGKRLDFLMQELQRESNTLGSKSVSQETSDVSMELKLLVEQIREQVQNLE